MDIRELPLDDLVLDPNLNLRDRLDDFTVERYAEAWERMPPVTVFEVDGRWLLADGFHRHAAAVMLGRRCDPAEVRQGTFTEALDFVVEVNLFHGLPLTRAERRRAVEIKLRLHHDWSDRRLAEELGVSRELVAKTRRSLIERGQVPEQPRAGRGRRQDLRLGRSAQGPERAAAQGQADRAAGRPARSRRPRERPAPLGRRDDPAAPAAKPPRDDGHNASPTPPWEARRRKAVALSDPVPSAAPTIDEMLALMAKQIMEVITWTQAEGFTEAYHEPAQCPRPFPVRRFQAGRAGRSDPEALTCPPRPGAALIRVPGISRTQVCQSEDS